jgi:hypothetical protein
LELELPAADFIRATIFATFCARDVVMLFTWLSSATTFLHFWQWKNGPGAVSIFTDVVPQSGHLQYCIPGHVLILSSP